MLNISVKKPMLSTVIQPIAAPQRQFILMPMSETIIDRIHQRLAALGISETHASRMASPNGSADTIRNIRRKWNKEGRVSATAQTLNALARILETSVQWLLDGSGDPSTEPNLVTMVPLVSWVAASGFCEAQTIEGHQIERLIPVSGLPEGDYIALEVRGDSMNLIAPDSSIIIANRRLKDLIDKKYYVAASDSGGETTFKRYREDWPPRLEPFSTNLDHKAINLQEPVRIIGRVVRVINDL